MTDYEKYQRLMNDYKEDLDFLQNEEAKENFLKVMLFTFITG